MLAIMGEICLHYANLSMIVQETKGDFPNIRKASCYDMTVRKMFPTLGKFVLITFSIMGKIFLTPRNFLH